MTKMKRLATCDIRGTYYAQAPCKTKTTQHSIAQHGTA